MSDSTTSEEQLSKLLERHTILQVQYENLRRNYNRLVRLLEGYEQALRDHKDAYHRVLREWQPLKKIFRQQHRYNHDG